MQKLLLFTLLLAGSMLQAQIASDGFDYTPGISVDETGTAGDGWAEGWTVLSDADTSRIVAGGLLNENLLPARLATGRC